MFTNAAIALKKSAGAGVLLGKNAQEKERLIDKARASRAEEPHPGGQPHRGFSG